VSPPEAELFLRLEKLRSELARDARRAVWQTIGALAVAFGVGVAAGHYLALKPFAGTGQALARSVSPLCSGLPERKACQRASNGFLGLGSASG